MERIILSLALVLDIRVCIQSYPDCSKKPNAVGGYQHSACQAWSRLTVLSSVLSDQLVVNRDGDHVV